MPIETDCLTESAVLWAVSDTDNYGEIIYASPVDINIKFFDQQSEILDPQTGNLAFISKAAVDRDIAVGSIIWEGTVAGIGAGDLNDAMEVIDFVSVPDIKNVETRRVVDLMNFKGTIPTS